MAQLGIPWPIPTSLRQRMSSQIMIQATVYFQNVYGQPAIKGIAVCTFQKVKFSAQLFIRSIFWHHSTYSHNRVKCIPNVMCFCIVRIGICKINDDIPSYGDEDQWTVIEFALIIYHYQCDVFNHIGIERLLFISFKATRSVVKMEVIL